MAGYVFAICLDGAPPFAGPSLAALLRAKLSSAAHDASADEVRAWLDPRVPAP